MNTQTGKRSWMNALLLLATMFIGASGSSAPGPEDMSGMRVADNADRSAGVHGEGNELPAEATSAITGTQPAKRSILPQRQQHDGVQANLFADHSWYSPPPTPEPVRTEPIVRTPTAPPLPYTYLGRYEQEGSGTLFYLVKGDRVYDVKIGDVIDSTYTVVGVSNGQLMFTYLPLNSSQGLRLGDQ